MNIKVGDYIKLKKGYKHTWVSYQENPMNYPEKVEYIDECPTKMISNYDVCVLCPGKVNGKCYGRGNDKYIVEPTNIDWDE